MNILKKSLKATVILSVFLLAIFSTQTAHAVSRALTGYAWSDNIGWIQFDPVFGGVSLDDISGDFSGYAWSDNIGWVSFDASDGAHPSAKINNISACGSVCAVSGWAKAIAADNNGWDGWISMSGAAPAYGVNLDTITGNFSGWAWGSDVVGWVSFSGVKLSSLSVMATYVIDPPSETKQIGQTQQFIGWYDQDGPGGPQAQQDKTASASWSSSDNAIASINSSGLAACSAAGSVTITSVYSGITATASLTCVVGAVLPPLPPSGLAAVAGTGVNCEKINLSWTDNSNNETKFEIERKIGAGAFAKIAQVGPNITVYQNSGLAGGANYTYRVRACNGAGCSAYSNESSAVAVACVAVPAYTLTKDGDIFATIIGGTDIVSSKTTIKVAADAGFTGDVVLSKFSVAPSDPGFTFHFSDNIISQAEYGAGSEFWTDVPGTAPEGLYTITVQGNSNGLLRQIAIQMNVTSANNDWWQW